jgi:hypothetical protein
MKALGDMRRDTREKELNALLSGNRDHCPCFIEVYLWHYLKKFGRRVHHITIVQ